MDILDEIDAAIQEKKSKWKYTPMREKRETDAIIDELLREFPSDDLEENGGEYQAPQTDVKPGAAEHEQPAEPEAEQEQGSRETEPYVYNEEQLERQQYENSLKKDIDDVTEEASEPEVYTEPETYDDIMDNYKEMPDISGEPEAYEEPEAEIEPAADDISEPVNEPENNDVQADSMPENIKDGTAEYNEYISRKYTDIKYEEDSEAPLYNDDEYDGEEDDDFEEFEEEMPEDSGKKKYTDRDFNNFMDSANDGEKGDMPKFSVSSAVLTILKILVLAGFGALAVVGIINTVSVGVDKYNNTKGKTGNTLKEELQSVIYPVVVTQTADFRSVSELTDEQLINIAVWEVVINGNKSVFMDSESGEFHLPQEQMVYIIEKLFGDNSGFKHTDSGIGEKKIIYDEKGKQYILPEDTDLYTLRPVVTDVAQTGDVFAVYADCYRSNPSWSNVKTDEPVKRVIVTLKKTADYYNITELKTIPLN